MLRITTLSLLLLALACGDDDAATDSGPATDAPAADAPAADAPAADAPAADAPTADAPDDDAGPTSCGGLGGGTCADTEFCDYPDNICGAADGTGTCQPRPEGCTDEVDPTCACDGTVYSNACEANAAGQDVNGLGGCEVPVGSFACGSRFCTTDSYCQVVIDDTGMPPAFHCGLLPAGCGDAPDCDCVSAEPCGDMCTADAAGNVTLTCPGG